ncbi:MAG: hypothetical protein RIQ79_1615, partial [Verrucomicrobiota bacterium]
ARAWMAASDDPAVKRAETSVQVATLEEIALDEPATALATWGQLQDPKVRAAAVMPLALAWAKRDPAAAVRWLEERGADGTDYLNSYQGTSVLTQWTKKDSDAALKWAEARATEDARMKALEALGGELHQDRLSWAAKTELYARVSDPALRARALTWQLRNWSMNEPEAAKAWKAAHPALVPPDSGINP